MSFQPPPRPLSGYEVFFGVLAGLIRWGEAMLFHTDPSDPPRSKWPVDHVTGALSEQFGAREANVYWLPVASEPTTLTSDIGENIQIRATRREDGRLILQPKDKDTDLFVLVVGLRHRWRIIGALYGHEGKRPEFWSDPGTGRPAFFVPQSQLRPWP